MTAVSLHDTLDALLAGAVAQDVAPGIMLAVTGRDDVLYEGAAGLRGVGAEQAVTPTTPLRIASMTKALVSVAALQLIEEGRLGLDDEVASIVPAFGDLQVLEGFDGDVPRLRPPARAATVAQLLTHTSGHGYWFSNADLLRYRELTGLPDIVMSERAALHAPLIADPGTRWEYGISTDWLGQVIEAVAGRTLGEQLAERVFAPLGMEQTTFRPSAEQRAQRLQLADRAPGGGLVASAYEWPEQPQIDAGGHGAWSTAHDYGRFLRALLRDGELDGARVLAPETVELAFTDRLGGIVLPEVVPTFAPELMHEVPSLPLAQGWGLGFQLLLEDLPELRCAGTGFWSGVFNTYFWVDRASGIAGTVMTQVRPFFDPAILGTAIELERAVYAALGERAGATAERG